MASAIVGAYGSLDQGQGAQTAGLYNARVLNANAAAAYDQGEAAAATEGRKVAAVLSAARANAGASGLDAGSGSFQDALQMSAQEGQLATDTIRYNARLRALGFSSEAALATMGADSARRASRWNAAGQLIQGGERIAGFTGIGGG